MGIQRQETLIHWNFFLSIEEDLDRIGRFVDFSGNDQTYSIEIARLFIAASAEVDVVLKQLCKAINSSSTASSINAYQDEIVNSVPHFKDFEVTVPNMVLL